MSVVADIILTCRLLEEVGDDNWPAMEDELMRPVFLDPEARRLTYREDHAAIKLQEYLTKPTAPAQ